MIEYIIKKGRQESIFAGTAMAAISHGKKESADSVWVVVYHNETKVGIYCGLLYAPSVQYCKSTKIPLLRTFLEAKKIERYYNSRPGGIK